MPSILPEELINVYYEPLEYVNKHSIRLLFIASPVEYTLLKYLSMIRLIRIFFFKYTERLVRISF